MPVLEERRELASTEHTGCAAFLRICLKNKHHGSSGAAVLVEVRQVLHPICSSLRHVDITDTSITNTGLQQLCKGRVQ